MWQFKNKFNSKHTSIRMSRKLNASVSFSIGTKSPSGKWGKTRRNSNKANDRPVKYVCTESAKFGSRNFCVKEDKFMMLESSKYKYYRTLR